MTAHDIINNYVIGYITDNKEITHKLLKEKLGSNYEVESHKYEVILEDLKNKSKGTLNWIIWEILQDLFESLTVKYEPQNPPSTSSCYYIYRLPNDFIKMEYNFKDIKPYDDKIKFIAMKEVKKWIPVVEYEVYD